MRQPLETVVRRFTRAPIFYAQTRLDAVLRVPLMTEALPESERRRLKFFAFCGIGNPVAFYDDLKSWDFSLVAQRSFPDHHRYSSAEIQELERRSCRCRSECPDLHRKMQNGSFWMTDFSTLSCSATPISSCSTPPIRLEAGASCPPAACESRAQVWRARISRSSLGRTMRQRLKRLFADSRGRRSFMHKLDSMRCSECR